MKLGTKTLLLQAKKQLREAHITLRAARVYEMDDETRDQITKLINKTKKLINKIQ